MNADGFPIHMTLTCAVCGTMSHWDDEAPRAGWVTWQKGGETETCVRYVALCPECAQRAKEAAQPS